VNDDCDDVGKIAGVFDINETSGSDCTKDVIENEDVTYSYSIDKILSILESIETDLEGVIMAEVLSESEPVTVNTNVLFSITDVVVVEFSSVSGWDITDDTIASLLVISDNSIELS
jgi:hypothetical protein